MCLLCTVAPLSHPYTLWWFAVIWRGEGWCSRAWGVPEAWQWRGLWRGVAVLAPTLPCLHARPALYPSLWNDDARRCALPCGTFPMLLSYCGAEHWWWSCVVCGPFPPLPLLPIRLTWRRCSRFLSPALERRAALARHGATLRGHRDTGASLLQPRHVQVFDPLGWTWGNSPAHRVHIRFLSTGCELEVGVSSTGAVALTRQCSVPGVFHSVPLPLPAGLGRLLPRQNTSRGSSESLVDLRTERWAMASYRGRVKSQQRLASTSMSLLSCNYFLQTIILFVKCVLLKANKSIDWRQVNLGGLGNASLFWIPLLFLLL